MMNEIVKLEPCASCGQSLESDARFCSGCGRSARKAQEAVGLRAAASDFASGTVQEAKSLSIEALKSDTGKKIAAGAALGATVGTILPLVGPMIGATLGAGYVAFKRLTK